MSNLQLNAQASPSVLTKILEPAAIRRFERVARVSRSCEIAASLRASHQFRDDEALGAVLSELLDLLVKEKVAAKMAHFLDQMDQMHDQRVSGAHVAMGTPASAAPAKSSFGSKLDALLFRRG